MASLRAGTAAFTTGTSKTTLAFTIPSGTLIGDTILIFAAAGLNSSSLTFTCSPFTPQPTVFGVSSGVGTLCLLSYQYAGTEGWTPGSTQVTVTASASHPWSGVICAVPGSSFDPALSGAGSGQVNSGQSTTIDVAGLTTAHASDLLVCFLYATSTPLNGGTAPATITVPSGFTAQATQANSSGSGVTNVGVQVGTATGGAAGATGAANGTASVAVNNGGVLIAVVAATTWTLTGSGTSSPAATGKLAAAEVLAGSAAPASLASGALAQAMALGGTSAAASATAAVLTGGSGGGTIWALTGASAGAPATTARLASAEVLTGTAPAASSTTALLSLLVPETFSVTYGGPGTWICPPGVTQVAVKGWGAGGGGGDSSSTANSSGGGGGSGEFAAEPVMAVTPGKSYAINVGTGGQGGTPATGGGSAPALLGSSANPGSMLNNPASWEAAATDYDTFVDRTMARQLQKGDSQSDGVPPYYSGMQNVLASNPGMQWLISLIPDKSLTTASFNNVRATCARMLSDGFSFMVTFDQEPNAGSKFASAAVYRAYVAFYINAVRFSDSGNSVPTGIKIVYDPAAGASAPTYYPGDQYIDVILIDYYSTAYASGQRLAALSALADGHTNGNSSAAGQNGTGTSSPIPFGIGEFGGSATGTLPPVANWTAYTNYIVSFFQGRTANGLDNTFICWFNGGGTNQPNNTIDQANDADFAAANPSYPAHGRIPAIQMIYDALNGVTSGGLGVPGTPASAGADTTFTDDNGLTLTANGGGPGGTGTNGTAGAAGSGSTNSVHFSGAAGGAGSGAHGGGGGAASAASTQAGAAGAAATSGGPGAGAVAVLDGGPGAGGSELAPGNSPASGPGGGGGGAANGGTAAFYAGGDGASGQMVLTYTQVPGQIGTPYEIGTVAVSQASSTLIIPVSQATVQGDAIIVGASVNNTGTTITGVTDDEGNTYEQAAVSATEFGAAIWVATSGPGASGPTVGLVGGSGGDNIYVTYSSAASAGQTGAAIGCRGIPPAAVADISVVASSAGSGSPSVASGTLAQPSELLVAMLVSHSTGGAPTWPPAWSPAVVPGFEAPVSNQWESMVAQVVSSASPVTASATLTSTFWTMLLISLPGAGATVWPLAGTASGGFAQQASGSFTQVMTAAGTSASASSASAAIAQASAGLAGSAASVSLGSATLAISEGISGAAAGASATAAALAVTEALRGTCAGTPVLAGAMGIPLAGTAAASSLAAGSLAWTAALAASAAGASAASGALAWLTPLAGAAAAASVASGALAWTAALAGQAGSASAASGSLAWITALSAAIAAHLVTSATLGAAWTLSGTGAAATATAAALYATGQPVPSLVAAQAAATNTATTLTVPAQAGVQEGDLILIWVAAGVS